MVQLDNKEENKKLNSLIFGVLLIALVVLILEETLDPWLELDHEPPTNIYGDIRSFSTPYMASAGTVSKTTAEPELS